MGVEGEASVCLVDSVPPSPSEGRGWAGVMGTGPWDRNSSTFSRATKGQSQNRGYSGVLSSAKTAALASGGRKWSGRLDLNQRSPGSRPGALPGYATPRMGWSGGRI